MIVLIAERSIDSRGIILIKDSNLSKLNRFVTYYQEEGRILI